MTEPRPPGRIRGTVNGKENRENDENILKSKRKQKQNLMQKMKQSLGGVAQFMSLPRLHPYSNVTLNEHPSGRSTSVADHQAQELRLHLIQATLR